MDVMEQSQSNKNKYKIMKMLESEAFLLYHFSGEPGHIIILFWIPNLNFPFIFLEGEGGSLASYFSFYALVFTCIKEKK